MNLNQNHHGNNGKLIGKKLEQIPNELTKENFEIKLKNID